jgi:hypothetical protein
LDELLNSKVVDEREFVRKLEWNVYEDFAKIRDKKIRVPEIYSRINM